MALTPSAAYYVVYLSTTPDETGRLMSSVAVADTSYIFYNLEYGTTYYWWL